MTRPAALQQVMGDRRKPYADPVATPQDDRLIALRGVKADGRLHHATPLATAGTASSSSAVTTMPGPSNWAKAACRRRAALRCAVPSRARFNAVRTSAGSDEAGRVVAAPAVRQRADRAGCSPP